MKKKLIILLVSALLALPACGQKSQSTQVIGFYNVENLFDTYHDEGKNDYEFLPDGGNAWTEAKYEKKLRNIARVIRAMKDENKTYHTILGLSEVENRHVLEDLVNQEAIADANYQIVHYDGPDRRGVDVALLYRPDQFKLIESKSIPFTFEGTKVEITLDEETQRNFRTRDVLMARGTIGGEMFAFFVAHLPSRLGGKGQDLRHRGAEIIYNEAMALMEEYPGIKIAVMGDMNDDPFDVSMTEGLHGVPEIGNVTDTDFFSPFYSMLKDGYGSLAYQGTWCLYDIIMVNSNLAHAQKGTYSIKPIVSKKYYGRVFRQPFMTEQEGKYVGQPFRTFSGGVFIGGYSDHYPTYIVISKK